MADENKEMGAIDVLLDEETVVIQRTADNAILQQCPASGNRVMFADDGLQTNITMDRMQKPYCCIQFPVRNAAPTAS